jgi:hypothetical protein
MSGQPIDAEDLAAALTAFSIEFATAIMSPHHQTPNELLEALANGLHAVAQQMSETPAREAVDLTAKMLFASEPGR